MEKFKYNNPGQVLIWVIFVIVTVVVVTGGLYYYLEKQITPEIPEIKEIPAEEIIPEEKPAELLCQDECPQLGFKSCFNNSYKTCGNYDPDNCLEWSLIANCPLNTICKNGECIETLSVSLSANPSGGSPPLKVELNAQISGIETGPANYIFYCNRSDPGTDIIPGYNKRTNYIFSSSYPDVCNYPSPGTYTAKVIAERGGLAAEDRVEVTVTPLPDFSLSVNPNTTKAPQTGTSQTSTITITSLNGFSSAVNLSVVSGLPIGATANFTPNPVTPLPNGTITSNFTVTTSNVAAGLYDLTIQGQSGALTRTITLTLEVVEEVVGLSVTLTANPSSGTAPLNDVDLTATVYKTATGPINYTFYCNRSDSGTNITPGYSYKKDGTTLNPYTAIDICNYSTAGIYTAKVIVERGTLVAESRVVITVSESFDFSISLNPSFSSVSQGGSVSATVTATLTSGTSQPVSFSASGLPSGATASFSPLSCNPTCSSKMQISTSSTTPPGTYSIKIAGTGGGLNRDTTYSLTVVPLYAIHPVVFLAADTNIDLSAYQTQVNNSFAVVRAWYSEQLGGKTFNLLPAIVYRSPLTQSQLYNQYGTAGGIWFEGLKQATAANGLNVCDDHRFYYFVTPIDNIWGGFVGAENLGCSYVLPGTASIPGHMGRLVGGIIDPNWPESWADEIREAQGGVAHEIAHGLGGSCTIGNFPGGGCNGLPHSAPGAGSIMFEWWEFGIGAGFLEEEKVQILKSPFIF